MITKTRFLDFPVTISKIEILCPFVKKVMHQATYMVEKSVYYSLEDANHYLFLTLRDRLRYPTSKFDVVLIKITLLDKTILESRIPLRYKEELFNFLSNLYYTRGINIIAYYGFITLNNKFQRALGSGVNPFSNILLKDIESRLSTAQS